jgi:ubiquinol-cytochrome c reductase cytochrome c subunit
MTCRRRWSAVRFALPPTASAVLALVLLATPAGSDGATSPVDHGAELFAVQCASCHGVRGDGVEGRGPSLRLEGEASADFVLRTGRMPLPDPYMQARRRPVRYSDEEIEALVAFVASIGTGPDTPAVDTDRGDLANGGHLYRLNCAACHVASGAGAAIGAGRDAPSLAQATPEQVGQAIVVGPGAMPVFGTFTPDDIDDVATYVQYLQDNGTTAPSTFGGAGPVAEGLAAWLLGLIPLVALTRWVGGPRDGGAA